jgi:hypothetical protein
MVMKRSLLPVLATVAVIATGCATTEPAVRLLRPAERLSWVVPISPPKSFAEQEAAASELAVPDPVVLPEPDDLWLGIRYRW